MQARGTKTGRMGRELRGGSWDNNSNNLDASNRNNNDPTNENNNNGFRVARPPAFFFERTRTAVSNGRRDPRRWEKVSVAGPDRGPTACLEHFGHLPEVVENKRGTGGGQ
jgi:hypothetical protein